jgi:NADH:ubiquinone oxidoreductase subunit 6 (subunit J)
VPESREPRKQQVFSITTAAESQTADRVRREKRYAVSMLIRTACFLGGVVLVMQPMPWAVAGWLMFVGAIFLPYVAVVFANAGVRKKGDGPSPFGPEAGKQIEPVRTHPIDRG